MQNGIDEQKPSRFKQPLTFKRLKERGLCPTCPSSLLLGLAALMVYNTGYIMWNLPRWAQRGFRRRLSEGERGRAGTGAALLAFAGALALCWAGPILLVALTASAWAWFLHAGAFLMAALGAAAVLIAAGLVRRRACARWDQRRWPGGRSLEIGHDQRWGHRS